MRRTDDLSLVGDVVFGTRSIFDSCNYMDISYIIIRQRATHEQNSESKGVNLFRYETTQQYV